MLIEGFSKLGGGGGTKPGLVENPVPNISKNKPAIINAIPLILLILSTLTHFVPTLENRPANMPINGIYTDDPNQKDPMKNIPSKTLGRVMLNVKAAMRGKHGRNPVSIPRNTVDLELLN